MLLPLLFTSAASAQDDADEVVVFVLDLSGSMNEPFDDQNTKLDVAKEAFVEAFTNVSPDARVGLRTYGDSIEPTTPDLRAPSCTTDTRVVAPVAPAQRDQLVSQVQGFTALGDTPMGLALQQAATDIPAGTTGTIVLFSDGRDECFDADLDGDPSSGPSFGQDPCEIAKSITNDNSAVDRVVTVGFRADAAAEIELRCIAESTGGSYTAIQTPEDARDALPELLVQLSAPREAQRQVGRAVQGGTSTETAADLVRLDELGADSALYTDTIDMNSKRFYRLPEYGPQGGTFTATVFGLPAELGIEFDMRIFVPKLDQRFFQGEHGDLDAGLPARPTASIRCTDCRITGGPYEAFFVVTLDSPEIDVEGTYELELLTEGPGFGGPTTSCSAPQACFYPREIADLDAELALLQAELDADVGDIAPEAMIAERNGLRTEQQVAEQAIDAANARAEVLEARLPLAPTKSNSFRSPLLLIVFGAVLGFAPLTKLRRSRDDNDEDEGEDKEQGAAVGGNDAAAPAVQPTEPIATAPGAVVSDVGPPPAISQALGSSGNNWDAELDAAKAALAQQRPSRPSAPDAMPSAPPTGEAQDAPGDAALSIHGQFTAAQHAAAKAAAEKIAAQQAAKAAAAQQAENQPAPTFAAPPGPALAPPVAPTLDIVDGQPAAQETTPAPDTDAATIAAAQASAREAAELAATEQAASGAAEQAAAEQAARDQAAGAAERAAAEQAAREQAAGAEQAAREQAEREAAERAAAEKAAAERAAAEQAAREAAEREAAEQAARERAAAEQAARQAAERAAADRAAAEKAAADQAAAEEAARQAAERAAADRAAAEKAAADLAAAEEAARQAAADRAAAEQAAAHAQAQRVEAEAAAAQAAAQRAQEEAAAQAAADQAAAVPSDSDSADTEEERRQEARQRMLAKQNIVASSSSGAGTPTSSARLDTAGTSAALRPMTVSPTSEAVAPSVQPSTPTAPGWYEDQAIVGQYRWWDGSTWTGFTSPDDQGPAPS